MLGKIEGIVTEWNSEAEFGCIQDHKGQSVFFNLREYRPPKKPTLNEEVLFIMSEDGEGRLQAFDIQELAFVRKQQGESIQSEEHQHTNIKDKLMKLSAQQINLILIGLVAALSFGLFLFYYF